MSKVKLKTKFDFDVKLFKNHKVKQKLISFAKKMKGHVSVKNNGTNDILLYINKKRVAQIHPGMKSNVSAENISSISIGCQPIANTKCRGTFKFKEGK